MPKLPEFESEGIYEEYDGEYEQYGGKYADRNGSGDFDKDGNGYKNRQEEGTYEQYDGDYEKYISKNGKSSNRTHPQHRVHRTANKRVR